MLKHISYESLYLSSLGWLKSRFHFSFAEYHNPNNVHFGALRVMNDDVIAPHSGFDTHPHKDMEIFTYVLEGALTHEDSLGNKETLYRGDIQYLSAGSGIYHSEKNEGDVPAHIIQTWILPQAKGLIPQYGSYTMDNNSRHNRWEHLFGPEGSEAVIKFYQDANVYATLQSKGIVSHFPLEEGRQIYLKVMQGEIVLNGVSIYEGDGVEMRGEALVIEASSDTHLLLIEMKAD